MNTNIQDKKLELSQRSVELLTKTKNKMDKYHDERLQLLSFSTDENPNLQEWEEFIEYFANILNE